MPPIKSIVPAGLVVASAIAAVSVAALVAPGEAIANRSDVVSSASATWTRISIQKTTSPESISIEVCGSASLVDGGISVADQRCEVVQLNPGQQRTIRGFISDCLNAWKKARGL